MDFRQDKKGYLLGMAFVFDEDGVLKEERALE